MTGPDLAAEFVLLAVRQPDLYHFRQCEVTCMQVVSSRVPAKKPEQPAPQAYSYGLQPCPCLIEQPTMEKGYALRRVTVLSEASGWQETSLETTQRETCSSHSNPESSLSSWRRHGVGRHGVETWSSSKETWMHNVTSTESLRHTCCRFCARCQSPIQFSRMTTPGLIKCALSMTSCVRTTWTEWNGPRCLPIYHV